MAEIFYLELDGKRIGHTEFEYADPPMGVVHGKILFDEIKSPYAFIRDHCIKNNIHIYIDEPDEHMIGAHIIPQLKVFTKKGSELMGSGGAISGMDSDDFIIEFYGVPSEVMETLFAHHSRKYDERW